MTLGMASRWTAGALGLAMILAAAAPAVARGPGGKHCHGGKSVERLESRLQSLDLAPAELAAVQAILDQAREDQSARRDEMRAAREQMKGLLRQDTPDAEAVMAQAEVVGGLRTEASKARLSTMLALREHLTAEQWEQLRPMKKHRGGKEF